MKTTVKKFNDKNLPELIRLYKPGSSIAELKRKWRCYVAPLKKASIYGKAEKKATARQAGK